MFWPSRVPVFYQFFEEGLPRTYGVQVACPGVREVLVTPGGTCRRVVVTLLLISIGLGSVVGVLVEKDL
jgi:hypothetical protein